MKRKIIIYLGYFALFLFLTLLFTYLRFPVEKLKGRLVSLVEGRFPVTLQIGSLSRRFPAGLRASGVTLSDHSAGPISVSFEEIEIEVSLLRLLSKRIALSFRAREQGGSIEGRLRHLPERDEIELTITDFPLAALAFLEARYGVALTGEGSGEITLSLDRNDPERNRGEVALDIAQLAMQGTPPFIGAMLEKGEAVNAGDVTLRAHLEGQVLTIDECVSNGDLEIDASGTVTLRNPLPRSRVDLSTKAKFGGPLSRLDSFVQTLTRKRKNADGFYSWRITGYLNQPRAR